jgi:hypothetical protein
MIPTQSIQRKKGTEMEQVPYKRTVLKFTNKKNPNAKTVTWPVAAYNYDTGEIIYKTAVEGPEDSIRQIATEFTQGLKKAYGEGVYVVSAPMEAWREGFSIPTRQGKKLARLVQNNERIGEPD